MKISILGAPVVNLHAFIENLTSYFGGTIKGKHYKTDFILYADLYVDDIGLNIEIIAPSGAIFFKNEVLGLAFSSSEALVFLFDFDKKFNSYEEQFSFFRDVVLQETMNLVNHKMSLFVVFKGAFSVSEIGFFDHIFYDNIKSFSRKEIVLIDGTFSKEKVLDFLKKICDK